MISTAEAHSVAWLRDAHAMEVGTLDDLERLARRVEHYPQLKARLEQHIERPAARSGACGSCSRA